jgi:hypothetical protein
MQDPQVQNDSSVDVSQEVKHGALVARRLVDGLQWGEGAIRPRAEYTASADQTKLVEAVLESVEPVSDAEAAYSSCTDGRLPVKLANGESIPVREQLVGADMVSAFYIAEALAERFYKDPAAPVVDRVRDVAEFLHDNQLLPSSHIGCGAAGGFVAITENAVRFGKNPQYVARLKDLLPRGVYDEDLHQELLAANEQRVKNNRYEGLSAQTFLDAVEAVSGQRAIAELKDDDRGVHGHVEEAIMRLNVPGKAINETKVAELTDGREVFGVNDTRMERLARLFARGNDQDYRIARIALEDFASTGHGTLAKDLPTYIVTEA